MTVNTDPQAEARTRLRLDIAYDGTAFHGWATQPGLRTVQGTLEGAIALVLRTTEEQVRLTVGGRTDAGVHARGQVAHLDLTGEQLRAWAGMRENDQSAPRLTGRRVNSVLKRSSPDVVITGVAAVPGDFDARFSALRRRYEYRIRPANSRPDPLTSRFTVDLPQEVDLAAMQRASSELLGLRDFTTFCKAREGATAVRTLLSFEWRTAEDGALAARIEADAFCHSMVRALIGAVVAVGIGRVSEQELRELTAACKRTSRFAVMPAHGLSLEEIAYPGNAELAARAEQTRAKRASVPEELQALIREDAEVPEDIGCVP